MKLDHVVKAQQFDRQTLDDVLDEAQRMEVIAAGAGSDLLRGKIMVTLFYEPSTRTRLSFESAMLRLGGQVLSSENARDFSSAAKGETLEDTIRVVEHYGHVIVMRHHESGAAVRAAHVSRIPIINAGDGPGQHPTQALLDLYTIRKEVGRLDHLHVSLVGDLANGRTVRSLVYLLAKYKGTRFSFVAPEVVRIGADIKEYLSRHEVPFEEVDELEPALRKSDVVYQTRVQKERFADKPEEYLRAKGKFIITRASMALMKSDAVLMHPLPRVDEIAQEVDLDPRAAYFRQAQNGLFVRMAVLKKVLLGG